MVSVEQRHEIGNLLTVIRGHAELLSLSAPAEFQSDLHTILLATTDAMLMLQQQDINTGVAEIRDVLKATLQLLRISLQHVNVRVRCDLCSLQIKPTSLRIMLMNLLLNAAEATPPGGTISITSICNDDMVAIQITDTGPGIDDSIAVFRIGSTSKPRGNGIGLWMVKNIVDSNNGSIDYESSQHGTTFTLHLPLAHVEMWQVNC